MFTVIFMSSSLILIITGLITITGLINLYFIYYFKSIQNTERFMSFELIKKMVSTVKLEEEEERKKY